MLHAVSKGSVSETETSQSQISQIECARVVAAFLNFAAATRARLLLTLDANTCSVTVQSIHEHPRQIGLRLKPCFRASR